MYIEISRAIVLLVSVVITAGLYHQAYRVWRTKKVDDITATIVVAILLNEFGWLNYGVALWEWPIVVVSAVNLPAAIAIVVGYFKFRRKGGMRGEYTAQGSTRQAV